MTSSKRAMLTPEEEAKSDEILDFPPEKEPAGSLEPMAERKGWAGCLDAAALSAAHTLREKIDAKIDEAVRNQINSKLGIGRLLNEGRALFPGDLEFGQWRKDHWPTIAPSTLSTMQRMAVEFKDSKQFLDKVGWSVGVELTGAAPRVWNEIERLVSDGETPTVKEVREIKKEVGKSPPPTSGDSAPVTDTGKKTGNVMTVDERCQRLRDEENVHERILKYKNWALPSPAGEYAFIGLMCTEGDESYPNHVLIHCFDHCLMDLEGGDIMWFEENIEAAIEADS